MDDAVMRYSDLIQPDGSIDELIRLLDKVQREYSTLTQAAKQYATNMQADMRRVNTSTKAGRDEMARLTAQVDTLDDVMRGLGDRYRLIDQELEAMRSETSQSVNSISALADQVQRYKEITASMRSMRSMFEGPSIQGLTDDNFLQSFKELENVISRTQPIFDEYLASASKVLLDLRRVQGALDFDASGRAAKDALDNLQIALMGLRAQYGSLEAKDRESEFGIVTKNNIDILRSAIVILNAEIEPFIDKTTELVKAQQGLGVAMSKEGQEAVALKQRTAELNKETRLHSIEISAEEGAYEKLKAQLELAKSEWKKLGKSKRDTTEAGQALIAHIIDLENQLKKLDSRLKGSTQGMSALEKAEQQLAYVQSEEGKQLSKVRSQISAINTERRLEEKMASDLAKAETRLEQARSAENVELHKKSIAIQEANRVAKLEAQLAEANEGSYNAMAAQYELNKIKIKNLAIANRELTAEEKELVGQTYTLRQEMKRVQEMTGVHTLSVGDYGKAWDSLGFSVVQIVRELPSAAMGLNTLFLAVSNNIPILIDEIGKLRKENQAFLDQNEPEKVKSVIGQISKSLFSWQTALIAVLTALSMHGDKIWGWITSLFRGRDAVISLRKAIRNLNKELKNSNDSYGSNIATFKKLQNQWSKLKTDMEKTEWLKNHEEAFDELGLSVTNIIEAERVLIDQADDVEKTFKKRAQAAAATALATKEYEKALEKEAKAERLRREIADKRAKEHEKRTGKSTIGSHIKTEAGEYVLTERDAYDFYYEYAGTYDPKVKKLNAEAKAAEETGDQYLRLGEIWDDIQDDDDKNGYGSGSGDGSDLTDRIYRARLQARKKYEESQTKLIKDEYDKRERELKASAQAEVEALEETQRKAIEWRDDPENDYEELTEDERKAIDEILEKTAANIVNIRKKLNEDLRLLAIDRQISTLKIQEETNDMTLKAVKKGSEEEYNLQKKALTLQYELLKKENEKLVGTGLALEEQVIIDAFLADMAKLTHEYNDFILQETIAGYQYRIDMLDNSNQEQLALARQFTLDILDLEEEREIAQNKQLAKNLQKDENLIRDSYARRRAMVKAGWAKDDYMAQLQADVINFETGVSAPTGPRPNTRGGRGLFGTSQVSEYQARVYAKEKEIEGLQYQIDNASNLGLTVNDVVLLEANLNKANTELDEMTKLSTLISEKGLGGGILTKLGFDDEQIGALQSATNIVIDQINAIMQAEIEAAEKAVELAQERVDAAQSVYDAEIEGRNNGYANNVATAKKELEQEKKNQREKQRILEEAQKRQEAINTITQASSLVTASAELWAAFAPGGAWGIAAAIAGIATMWASFAAAKIKAAQVTSTYGEGGLEFLEGGSHASGNDIDLGTTNSKGRRMRAEGGEAMAIINKRNTKKYRKVLPDIIDSLNAGIFEEKYMNSLDTTGLSTIVVQPSNIDLSRIENSVDDIRKQSQVRYYSMDGYLVIQDKNVKRIIKN